MKCQIHICLSIETIWTSLKLLGLKIWFILPLARIVLFGTFQLSWLIRNIDRLLCLDRLKITWTRGSFVSFSFISFKRKIIGDSELDSWGCFNASIDSCVSTAVSNFSNNLSLTISSIKRPQSFSLRMIWIINIGFKLLSHFVSFWYKFWCRAAE